jgi:hypothetical protein
LEQVYKITILLKSVPTVTSLMTNDGRICLSQADLSVNNVMVANQNRSMIYLIRVLQIFLPVNFKHLSAITLIETKKNSLTIWRVSINCAK